MRKCIWIILFSLLLSACTAAPEPSTTEVQETTAGKSLPETVTGVITGYGVDSEGELDSSGLYFPYTGGEMSLDLFLRAEGLSQEGVAVMLFLDGIPQPFRVGDSETVYQYMLYPEDYADSGCTVRFNPITGQAGDLLDLCILYFPSLYSPGEWENTHPFYQEDGARFFLLRIKFETTPPDSYHGVLYDRALSNQITYSDIDLSSWAVDGVAWNVSFQGKRDRSKLYSFDSSEPLELEFEMYGDPTASYRLVVYINGDPVCFGWDDRFPLQAPENKKLTLTAQLDCSDFVEGEQLVFALLLRRNHFQDSHWTYYPESTDIRHVHMYTADAEE